MHRKCRGCVWGEQRGTEGDVFAESPHVIPEEAGFHRGSESFASCRIAAEPLGPACQPQPRSWSRGEEMQMRTNLARSRSDGSASGKRCHP